MKSRYVRQSVCPISIAILALLCHTGLHAKNEAGQAGALLRHGVGGRAMGMGKAFVAISDDASGVYWNPAGILRAEQIGFTSMYSDLYYDSRYSFAGVIWPRPIVEPTSKWLSFFFGPATAVGFGWTGFQMTGFEQRSETGLYIGDFDYGQNAFFASWAREWHGDWGILDYGLTWKFLNENTPDLVTESSRNLNAPGRNWASGLDAGLTFQPIHAPLFRIISLKYLLPLKFGFSLQNLLQPEWDYQLSKEKLPRVVRYGLAYQWNLCDWIPESWAHVYDTFQFSSVLMAYDREEYDGIQSHSFFGLEGSFPLGQTGVVFQPRWGANNETQNRSAGCGLVFPFSKGASIQLDYATGLHPDLENDQQFFVSVNFGSKRDAGFFNKLAKKPENNADQAKEYWLLSIARYPGEASAEAADAMLDYPDSTYINRYYTLTRGQTKAAWLLKESKRLLRDGNEGKARKRAEDAVKEYMPLFLDSENLLSDEELLDFGEALIISEKYSNAITALSESHSNSLRQYYLLATAQKYTRNWDSAIEMYGRAIKQISGTDNQSMHALSLFGLSECLVQKMQYASAMTSLNTLLKNHTGQLDAQYPRYPIIEDDYIQDDAQFLLGICASLSGRYEDAIAAYMNIVRLYPGLSYGSTIETDADGLVKILREKNWEALQALSRKYLYEYNQSHQLTNE